MLRLALAGCGEHSRGSHAAPLARYAALHPGELTLVAACDLNLDRAAAVCRDYGFARPYRDFNEMLERERPDACVAVMPMELIAETGALLLERGLPCLIEKPLGTSPAEIERLARVAQQTGTPHLVSVNRRFMPYLNRARAWAAECGPVRYVRASMVRHARNEPEFIWSTAIHALDALRYLAGEVVSFEAEVYRPRELSARWYDITLRLTGDVRGRLEVMPTAGMVEETYELLGENFRARVVTAAGSQLSLHGWRENRLVLEESVAADEPEEVRNGSYGEVEEFVGALREGRPPRPAIADVMPSVLTCFRLADATASS